MTSLSDYAASTVPDPKGWEPYSEEAGADGKAVVKLARFGVDDRELLLEAGFDPDTWRVKGSVNTRRWMRHDREWLYYYKFDVEKGRENSAQRELDVEALVKMLEKRRSRTRPQVQRAGDDAHLTVVSDWQIGKGEGDGTLGTVSRVEDALDQNLLRIKQLRKLGRLMPTGALVGTGDLLEGTCGFYANQGYLIDANRREQLRIARRLITLYIDELAPLFDHFVVATVGGNHGENRNADGKKNTDDADNDDVGVFETVQEAVLRSGRPDNIEWFIPYDEMSILLQLGGVPVGFTHGHMFSRGSGLVQSKALEWWKSQVFGLQEVADAKILVSSHYHHFSAIDHGGRVHLQTPAMDPGSEWYRKMTGADSAPGTLTLRLDSTKPLGYGDLEIL